MKPEIEIILERSLENDELIPPDGLPEPRTELGAKLIALAREIDRSGLPKLSIEEIEEYLGRELGGIAAAYGDTIRKQ
jgi:hypothetical protein